jgi:twitching motility protein PilT
MGMLSMDQCLRDLYMKGIITMEEAMNRCQNIEELKKMINMGGQTGAPSAPNRR